MKPAPIDSPQRPPYKLARYFFDPAAIEPIVGKKRIGEMTADEYRQLAVEAQIAVAERGKR